MARPKKDPALLKESHLRIPVTEEQKALVQKAAQNAGEDFAPWARAILLKAAVEGIASGTRKRRGANRDQ